MKNKDQMKSLRKNLNEKIEEFHMQAAEIMELSRQVDDAIAKFLDDELVTKTSKSSKANIQR